MKNTYYELNLYCGCFLFFHYFCYVCYKLILFVTLSLQEKIMEQLHAHEVLHMMEGNSYTELSLKEAIIRKFGKEQRFYACSADNMDIDTLIGFLKMKGKFMPTGDGFTVDITMVCNY